MKPQVKIALIQKDTSLGEIADRVGVSKALVSRMLAGKFKGYKHRTKIARLLGLTVADAFGENGDAR